MDTREVASQYRLSKWTEIVRQCRSSGQTVAVWCSENNINTTSYYYWLRRIRKVACEALLSMCGNSVIVPVNIPVHTVEIDSPGQASSSDIVVRMGAVTLEISNNASATLIENTLKALHHVR
ncbi:MAG: IS66 family insertion sequence element accessory protein TnpB [Desulfitobacterium sp.]